MNFRLSSFVSWIFLELTAQGYLSDKSCEMGLSLRGLSRGYIHMPSLQISDEAIIIDSPREEGVPATINNQPVETENVSVKHTIKFPIILGQRTKTGKWKKKKGNFDVKTAYNFTDYQNLLNEGYEEFDTNLITPQINNPELPLS